MHATEVHVWYIGVDDAASARRVIALLPNDERTRLGLLAQPHRRRHLCAQGALRILAASATTGVFPLAELVRGRNGKPVMTAWGATADARPPSAGTAPLQVSLSHSGSAAAVALTVAGTAGVDIEQVRRLPDPDGLARTFMSGHEQRQWSRLSPADRDAALLSSWTRKEAVLKALGTGLAGDMRSVSAPLSPPHGCPVLLQALPVGAGEPAEWSVWDLPPHADYVGAIAVRAPGVVLVRHVTTIADLLARLGPIAGAQAQEAAAAHTVPPPRSLQHAEGDAAVRHTSEPRPAAPLVQAMSGPPAARIKLFCLPHAGGNAAHFYSWSRWLPGGIDVVPVELPGHGTRLREPLVEDWRTLLDDLTDAVASHLTGAYVLFGHSLGAVLAYEVARILQGRGTTPALLVAAGRNGPSAALSHRPIHQLPDAELLAALRRLGGISDGLLREPDLLRMFLPCLRTDLRFAECYERAPGPPLSCAILAVAGRRDRMTDEAGMRAWRRETSGTCDLVVVDDGHFFLQRPEFTDALAARLSCLGTETQAGQRTATGEPETGQLSHQL